MLIVCFVQFLLSLQHLLHFIDDIASVSILGKVLHVLHTLIMHLMEFLSQRADEINESLFENELCFIFLMNCVLHAFLI